MDLIKVNTLWLEQIGCQFTDKTLKHIYLNEIAHFQKKIIEMYYQVSNWQY